MDQQTTHEFTTEQRAQLTTFFTKYLRGKKCQICNTPIQQLGSVVEIKSLTGPGLCTAQEKWLRFMCHTCGNILLFSPHAAGVDMWYPPIK
jgi:hypothetical protein